MDIGTLIVGLQVATPCKRASLLSMAEDSEKHFRVFVNMVCYAMNMRMRIECLEQTLEFRRNTRLLSVLRSTPLSTILKLTDDNERRQCQHIRNNWHSLHLKVKSDIRERNLDHMVLSRQTQTFHEACSQLRTVYDKMPDFAPDVFRDDFQPMLKKLNDCRNLARNLIEMYAPYFWTKFTLVPPLFSIEYTHEEDLAQKLKVRYCDSQGKETKCSIQCIEIFLRMGRLYVKKADSSSGMDQKLSFIKAATLLHAARVRLDNYRRVPELNEHPSIQHLHEKILHSLNQMQNILLIQCSCVAEVPLMEISQRILSSFESYRVEEKKVPDSLEIIRDVSMEKIDRKIELIENLMLRNSGNYKKQMKEIALYCLEILGIPLCDFAIVGLGSLARNEVTLRSDFEHVIILEDGVRGREDYGKILEYFRWFSVVFHVIIIGIGETTIPSIGIETLNNFYSEDKSKNWFYDAITPSGVSFDGMMPHACKVPLGRQIGTKNKDHIVELIKPVYEMAEYLTQKEDMVNGYHLKDVLGDSCYVFGSEKLFDDFERRARKNIEQNRMPTEEDYVKVFWQGIYEHFDRVIHVPSVPGVLCDSAVHPKKYFYRPLSLAIYRLCLLKRGSGRSTFDRIRSLGCLSQRQQKSILFGFVAACEMRLKASAEEDGNRMKVGGLDMLAHTGKLCTTQCMVLYPVIHAYISSQTDCFNYLPV